MVKLADAPDSKSGGLTPVWVRFPPPAPFLRQHGSSGYGTLAVLYHSPVPSPARVAALVVLSLLPVCRPAHGQALPRLPAARLDVVAPSTRVAGPPGGMRVDTTSCRTVPPSDLRQRIVDVAVQEWAFFGFPIIDRTQLAQTEQDDDPAARARRRPRLPEEEASRVAATIAGYWTATPSAGWALARQNEEWKGPEGIGARWQYPWSAAFVSWVMCESGFGVNQFQRAVAHHTYIDQAIRAGAGGSRAAFVAVEVGEAAVEPGDLLCSARRPAYRTVSERARHLGEGARTHCDIVVRVDPGTETILAIGGNVGARVSLKLLPGERVAGRMRAKVISLGRRGRSAFAHLQLRAPAAAGVAFDRSPTMREIGCSGTGRYTAVTARLPGVGRAGMCTE